MVPVSEEFFIFLSVIFSQRTKTYLGYKATSYFKHLCAILGNKIYLIKPTFTWISILGDLIVEVNDIVKSSHKEIL